MNQMLIRARKSVFLATGISLLAMTSALVGEVTVWSWDPNFNGATMKRLKYLATYVHGDKPETGKIKRLLEGDF